jgi:carboxypeptidase Q
MTRRTLLALTAPPLLAAPAKSTLTEAYRAGAARLIGAALTDADGWRKMMYLCDRVGHRLTGSPALEEAVRWAAAEMKREGLDNVATPLVKVPHWVRGDERADIVAPVEVPMAMLGLGQSVGTPAAGITADVVAVGSFEELEKLGAARVGGKIVLYNVPYQGYGRTVTFRSEGASRAGKLGAVAALVRSVGIPGHRTPHTGVMEYADGVPKIPAAAISAEDALLIQRLIDTGETVRVQLKMSARTLPDADSANVIGEIVGREKPEEVVVIGGHLDSWDVGQGAQDDGCGCVACWQAAVLIKQLGLRPRRTLRVVLFTNEETQQAGAKAYFKSVSGQVKNHVAALEMDGGAERPTGFGLALANATSEQWSRALGRAQEIGALLEGIGAGQITQGGGGADIGPLVREGVPGLGHRTVGTRYFEWHHTPSDTLDKIDPREFQLNVAAIAVMSYVLADMPGRLVE